MEKIPEAFLHYVWKYKYFNNSKTLTAEGNSIQIIDQGTYNKDAGPDFFNAKVKIDETIWAGNIEIHIHSSDWYKHNHHTDKAYDNVILQVVIDHNENIYRTNGSHIPTLEISFNTELLNNYQNLLNSEQWIPCQNEISEISHFTRVFWIDKLGIERLESKYNQINETLAKNKNDWETTFYQKLARNFGFKTNAIPFEMLASSLPIESLSKNKDNLFQLEALFFGQAGFLEEQLTDNDYFIKLKNEYDYLRKRFNLTPLENHLWKFSKLRPSNFPTIRIAQFAKLIHKSSRLFSKILEKQELKEIYELFDIELEGFWLTHYTFQKESKKQNKKLGKQAVITVIINTIVPFLFIFGERKDKDEYKDKAIKYLNELPPENNNITKKWKNLGIKPENAYQTQALIHLKNHYCDQKKCLECDIGNKLIIRDKNERI
jgi:hypothetical protein